MIERKKIRELKPGDLVVLNSGLPMPVITCQRDRLFDGDAWTVETGMGTDTANGNDVVEVETPRTLGKTS